MTALTLRVVFCLPLRQTEGFLDSLLSLMGLDLAAPDHTTLSRRNQIAEVPPLKRTHDGPICLIVDSTGLNLPTMTGGPDSPKGGVGVHCGQCRPGLNPLPVEKPPVN